MIGQEMGSDEEAVPIGGETARLVFINAMSRNGSSLLYQLLIGHSDLYPYPARIDFSCARPRCFPLRSTERFSVDEFVDRLADKHFLDIGSTWQTMKHLRIRDVDRVRFGKFRQRAIADLSRFGPTVADANRAYCIRAFMKQFVIHYDGEEGAERFARARYVLLQEDHAFNCGVEGFAHNFPGSPLIQVIRNCQDVLASRKNMLLFRLGYMGDPRARTLSRKVIHAETMRWIWSVMAAILNERESNDGYHIVGFEALRREREPTVRQVIDALGLRFESVVLEESSIDDGFGGYHGMLLPGSSLKEVTGGKHERRVGAHQLSLNEFEQDVLRTLMGDALPQPGGAGTDEASLPEAVRLVLGDWGALSERAPLDEWLQLRAERRYASIMEAYSRLNYGAANATAAFEEETNSDAVRT